MIKKRYAMVMVLVIALGSFLLGSWYSQRSDSRVEASAGHSDRHYSCPMHPQYRSERPGDCPLCGMRLEASGDDDKHEHVVAGGRSPAAVHIGSGAQRVIGIRTTVVAKNPGTQSVRLLGSVAADEARTFILNAAVDGWIREVHPFSTGSAVKKGQPLATFYSKEFLPAQQNYFYALNTLDRLKKSQLTTPEQINLTNIQVWAQEDGLEGLGMDATQIREIAESRKYVRNVTLRAPADGFVLARNVSVGQRFQRGSELYRIADLRRIWILANVTAEEVQHIRPGQQLKVRHQGREFRAAVSEILPQFDTGSRTLKARLEMENPGYVLKPDMFVDVELPVSLPAAVTVPADAVVDSGLKKTVYVAQGDGYFEPRMVETGWRFGDQVEIVKGLMPGERVVVSGNFLLDSESRMRMTGKESETARKAAATFKDPVCGMDVEPAKAAGKSVHDGTTHYFCSGQCKRDFDKNPQAVLASMRIGGAHQ
ncbi:MAG: efflux RND transporter periplasmic adaptor subunit [Acidobacteriales bacterium]|nr:MAG: efflux RND transporter periplasmic adaptor subunit [Terriglobales bacterium]